MRITLCTLNSRFIHSSLALRYLRAALQPHYEQVTLREYQTHDDQRRVIADIFMLQPNIVALSCYIWNIGESLELAHDLKKVLPEATIVLGGPEAGPRAAEILQTEQSIDYIIAGEGEHSFLQLIRVLTVKECDPSSVPGLCYRHGGQIVSNPVQGSMQPADIPAPYHPAELAELENRLVYYETSRGCPFSCAYCLSGDDQVRLFPLDKVFRELKILLEADIPLIKFVDRTFNCNPERAREIMEFLLRERRTSTFHFEICVDLLDEAFLAFLAQVPAGVFQFEIGVQSTNPATLKAINRRMNWERVAVNVQSLQQAGNIHLHLDLIAGLPYEDWESFRKSCNDVLQLEPDRLQLGFLKLLPGTRLREASASFGYCHSRRPPYEVLESQWLSFAELNRLHLIESLLESYYNSRLLRYTIPYLWQHFSSPFDFWQELADYWQAAGHHLRAHGLEALFANVVAFADEKGLGHDLVCGELLQLDKARVLPSFPATYRLPPEHRAAWEQYLTSSLPEFAPRTFKQAFRTVFPVWLSPETSRHLGKPGEVAVIDRTSKDIHEITSFLDSKSPEH